MEITPSVIENKLSGSTLGERHKSLNQLVREPPPEVLDYVKLSNKKQVDLVYMGRLANHTKDASVICELLKSEDSMVVSVALQSKWFFTATTHPHMANVRYFEKEVFPYATHHAVCRIISTFGACLQDETVAEDLYNYVIEWYGKKLAVKLLPKCSVNFIRSQIMDSLSDVPCAQMFYIYKKDKALAVEYLEKYLSKEKASKLPISFFLKMNYDRIWKLLAEDNPQLFINLSNKYHNDIKVQLGHRMMKRVLKLASEKVIQNLDKYSDIISKKHVVTILKGDELEEYLLNCMPSRENDLSPYGDDVFSHLKPEYRLKMLVKLYPIKYNGAAFIDGRDFLEWDLFEYLSKEERNMWAVKKIQNIRAGYVIRAENYFMYLDARDGISRLQELCRRTPDSDKRSKYLDDMVECCKNNNDKDALLELLKYVAKRHKNDDASLRVEFLSSVRAGFTLHKLSSEYFDIIHEMLDYLIIEKEIEQGYYSASLLLYIEREYIQYCFINGLDFSKSVEKLIQFNFYYTSTEWEIKDPELEFNLFSAYNEKYKQIITLRENPTNSKYGDMISKLISSIINMKPKISLSDYTWILDYLVNFEDWKKCDHSRNLILETIKKDTNLSDMFIKEILENVNDSSFIKFYVMFRSEILVNNMQHFLNNSFKYSNRRYLKIYEKIYTYLRQPLGQKMAEALEKHMSEDSVKHGEQLAVDIMYLSHLLPSAQREELIRAYAPANLKVDMKNNRDQYEVRRILVKCMKTLNPPVQLDTLMLYIGGDYLKYSLSSLLSLSFRKSRGEAKALILDLTKKPVSIKKHSIRMAYFLRPREELLPLYKSLWDGERNFSMRNVVFTFTFKLLLTEENMDKYQDIWNTLKYFMSSLSEEDIDIFQYLTRPRDIMPAFVSDYCDTCWKTLKQLTVNKKHVSDHVNTLSGNLLSCMDLLSDEFCEQIIVEYLSSVETNESETSDVLFTILVNYLFKANDSEAQRKNIDSICRVYKEYINAKWYIAVDGEYKHRRIIRDFVLRCCAESLNDNLNVSPVNLLRTVSEMLSSTLPQPSVMDLHIRLNATIWYKELLLNPRFMDSTGGSIIPEVSAVDRQSFESFGEKISMYLNDFCSQYGTAATRLFISKFVEWMFPIFIKSEKFPLALHFISGLLHGEVTQQCFWMAVELIPVVSCDNKDNFRLYGELLSRIIKEADVGVKVILSNKVEHRKNWFTEGLSKTNNKHIF